VGAPAAPAAHAATADAPASAPGGLARLLGPREVCKDQDPSKVGACVKRLCDNEPRYRNYPICQKVRHQEEAQQQREPAE
jgi:hypothetical protein